MKKILSALSSLMIAFLMPLNAQDCAQSFYALKEGIHFQTAFYNDKNQMALTSDQIIKSVTTSSTGMEATIVQNMTDNKGKTLLANSTSTIKCENGVVKMNIYDMRIGETLSKFKDMNVTINGDGITIPPALEVGQALPGGSSEIKVGMGGMNLMTMNFNISNRKVEAKESKTTPAGTFDCYKLSYDMDMKMMGKRSYHVVQWISKGVGIVRSENYKNDKLESYMELNKFDK